MANSSDIKVKKRNGEEEQYNVEKINKMLICATEGLSGVSPSDIAFNCELNLREGISTSEIQQLLIKSANDLISEEAPNYQYVAARLLLISLKKDVWGNDQPPKLLDHIKNNCSNDLYDDSLLSAYTPSEINKIETYIKHKRDDLFTYAGLQQFCDKYLLKNRDTGEIYETPQFAYICISMILAQNEGKNGDRLAYIKQLYDYISTFKINLPTPILAGVRTKTRQFSSCILIDCDDTLDSIFTTAAIAGKYTAKRAGIGINMGRVRPIGSKIRSGEVVHTGIIPYLKVMESAVKSTSQNGIRGGSATVSIPWWHYEIQDVMQLKNNGGTDENRVRKLDYCVQFDKTFYQALIKEEYVYLFSPDECRDLYDEFGKEDFYELYQSYTRKTSLKFKKKVKASDLAAIFAKERIETGRIYSMNIDHVNQAGAWNEPVKMTNLCVEITQPTIPCQTETDEMARIGVCTLGALNVLEVKEQEIEIACKLIVKILNFVIDYQDYPFKAAENFAKRTRSLGVGITNLAAWLAFNKMKYGEPDSLVQINKLMESVQYNLLSASCSEAEEKGECEDFSMTKYCKGLLPTDWYNKKVDELVGPETTKDWDKLKRRIEVHGLRNCTLTAQMPCESSSVIQNATNGIEPVRALMSYKKAKNGKLKQLVPHFKKYKNYYDLAFDFKSNLPIIKTSAVIQKWIDMAMSTNLYYNYDDYEAGIIPLSEVMKDQLTAYKYGIKNLYYANTPDGDEEVKESCEGGACTL